MQLTFEGRELFWQQRAAQQWIDVLRQRILTALKVQSYRTVSASNRHNVIDAVVARCAIRPVNLQQAAVEWNVATRRGENGDVKIRVAKSIRYDGDPLLFDIQPEAAWLPSPRATITPTHIQFAVLAEVSAVADSGAALEHAEHRVRRFLKWQNHDVFDANRMLPELVAAALRNRCTAVDEQVYEQGLRIAG
ncbi:MAG: hypothetical protein ABIO86_18590 [Sphingomonas sp.]